MPPHYHERTAIPSVVERPRADTGSRFSSGASVVLLSLVAFLCIDALLFVTPFYRNLLAPDSAAGSFERAIGRVERATAVPSRDVLVLGDSRIFNGLDAAAADAAAPGLHFVNAAVPGTTPRCWTVFDRVVDPQADRYRAIVIPVDSYADDDSAIGSIDGDDRPFDLRYIALRTDPGEVASIAQSFSPGERISVFFDLALRGPLVREDVQNFNLDPAARFAALANGSALDRPQPRRETLAGLRIGFATGTLSGRTLTPADEAALRRQLFAVVHASPSYARYRREWLGAIAARYAHTHIPVVFVRIPTRPAHRTLPPPPSGTILAFAREPGAFVLAQAPYLALERPELFADADHLNASGSARFSALLGRDVARVVREPRGFARQAAPPAPPGSVVRERVAPPRSAVAAFAAALGIGVPMHFQSYEYALFFAALATFVALVRVRRARSLGLLAASWYFYARWNAWYLAVLLGLTATDYGFALLVSASAGVRRRAFLALGVCANLAFLSTAKYADFVTATVARALGIPNDPWALHVLVPVGISFHTFQSISYLVDVARRKTEAVRDPLDYALYIAFFPQLLAGPIVRASVFFGELWQGRRPESAAVVRGLGEIAIGLFKKGVLADRFAPVADAYFGALPAHPGMAAAWSGALAFALQIYFDFSGYSDIAIGCARVLGFDFPQNFRRPYLAWSVTEFWRRWHMTLSAWLRDYLYIPLGGNRHGRAATYRNLMLTMLLGGLWHGANWTFVAWGAYHGGLLAVERALRLGQAPRGVRRALGTVVTFVLVLAGWMLFRAQSFELAADALRALVAGGPGPGLLDRGQLALAGIALAVEIAIEAGALRGRHPMPPAGRVAIATALLLGLELATYPGAAAPFVYFKF